MQNAMKLLSVLLAFTLIAAGAGALLADDHDGPGKEAGSGHDEHPGHEKSKDSPSASASPTTTPEASPSPSPAK